MSALPDTPAIVTGEWLTNLKKQLTVAPEHPHQLPKGSPMRLAATALATLFAMTACSAPQAAEPETTEAATSEAGDEAEDSETERLNAYFETVYNEAVARSPMQQTFLGIRDDYDKWDDASAEAALQDMEFQRKAVADMKDQFSFDELDEQGQLSWRLAEYDLKQAELAFKWRDHTYVFNQMFGTQSRIPSFLIGQHKVISEDDARDYVSRLQGIPTYLGQNVTNAANYAELDVRPPAFVYDYVLSDARNIITGYPFDDTPDAPSPLYKDISDKLDALVADGETDRETADAILANAETALIESVEPAYEELITFLESDLENANTDDGAWKLPDGSEYYNDRLKIITTTDMSADQIHALGLAEMDRIHGEMREIMKEVGFEGTLQDFFDFTRTDPQFFKSNDEAGKAEYLEEATAIIDTMRENLPQVFNTFPAAPIEVRAVEAFREKSAGKAFYNRPAPDGSRPGIYYANLYNMADMPVYQMEALAYHEGIPGHHMQLAISQELEGIPKFRKYGGYTAYTEGWGLYSEHLGKDMGFYEDPYSDFGRLAMELWRAARLVVDTGIHDKKWTREEAIAYLIENTPNPEGDCRKAIERYIVMPGQATAYKIGMNKLLELRQQAQEELGEDFSMGEFHDTVLKNGPLPLAILEEQVEAWINEKKND